MLSIGLGETATAFFCQNNHSLFGVRNGVLGGNKNEDDNRWM